MLVMNSSLRFFSILHLLLHPYSLFRKLFKMTDTRRRNGSRSTKNLGLVRDRHPQNILHLEPQYSYCLIFRLYESWSLKNVHIIINTYLVNTQSTMLGPIFLLALPFWTRYSNFCQNSQTSIYQILCILFQCS